MALAFILSPLLVLAAGGLLLMLAEAFARPGRRGGLALGTTMIFAAGFAFSIGVWLYGVEDVPERTMLAPWIVIDRFTIFFDALLCLGGALAALLAGGYLPEHQIERGEFYMLLLFATIGAMMLAAAGDVLIVFLGLETMSIGAYALTAFRRTSPRSAEGALKYFLLGAFAAALLLYGFALLYGATGHTDLAGIGEAVKKGGEKSPMLIIALVLVLAGLLFKVSAVPFHMWTPDAYEGAPTPATTYMGSVVKAGAFAMMLRVLLTCFGDRASMSWSAGWPPGPRVDRGHHDDRRQPRRGPAGVGQAHARLLEHRPRRLPARRRRGVHALAVAGRLECPLLLAHVHGLDRGRVRRAHLLR